MMTYLKHVGGKKHADLKTKTFEEIQVLYERLKKSDENFIAIGSTEDERLIKEMNEQVDDPSKKIVKKDDSVKEEVKKEEGTRKRKLGTRKKIKSKKRKFSKDTSKDDESEAEKENNELRLCLVITPDDDKEVDYETLDKKFPIIEWKSEYLTIRPHFDATKALEEQDWKVVNWKLHDSSGVHTLMTDEGLVIHIVMENKYPLRKEVLSQMLELKLETEEDSTMALELIRFVKKLIAEMEPENLNGDEEGP
ncbi:hypothetical protein Tco_0065067 [Tanacetum coccineum]